MSTGANQPEAVNPLVPELQTVPEVASALSEMEAAVQEVDTTVKSPDHVVSGDKQPEQDGSCRELVEDANVSTQNDSEVKFVKKPGEFTTEVFKIEIRNLPRYSGYKVT